MNRSTESKDHKPSRMSLRMTLTRCCCSDPRRSPSLNVAAVTNNLQRFCESEPFPAKARKLKLSHQQLQATMPSSARLSECASRELLTTLYFPKIPKTLENGANPREPSSSVAQRSPMDTLSSTPPGEIGDIFRGDTARIDPFLHEGRSYPSPQETPLGLSM